MSAQALSVCIPARNEENTILSTVNSALNQDFQGELEVIVCANACTDNTEKVVERISSKKKNVRLITSEPGKPNAWNKLVEEASFNKLIFLDGDVIVKQGSFSAIDEVYNKSRDIYGVSGGYIKVLDNINLFSRIINMPIDIPPGDYGFVGRLYSVKRNNFNKMMNKKGYSKMPTDIINEDFWASLILEERENYEPIRKFWDKTNKAKVYYNPVNLSDYLTERIRVFQGEIQIAYDHKELQHSIKLSKRFKQRFSGWYSRWKELDNNFDKIIVPVVVISKKVFYKALNIYAFQKAKKMYLRGEATNLWEPTLSSKNSFNENILNSIKTVSDN